MKYKEGDRVMIRRDLELTDRSPEVVPDMLRYRGREGTISEIIDETDFTFKEWSWRWADWMVEDIDENIDLFNSLK